MTAKIITIGDEILIGHTLDTNSSWMAKQLTEDGVEITEHRSISDDKTQIIDTLEHANSADIVLITGGLGPTRDDITKIAIIDFFNTTLEFDQISYDRIVEAFDKRDIPLTPLHKEQCFLPKSAELLPNKKGTAPGMLLEKNKTIYVFMPGVPYEMKYLMEFEVFPKIRKIHQQKIVAHRTIQTIGAGETAIARRIIDFEDNLPDHIGLAYLPSLGTVRLRLSSKGENPSTINSELDDKITELAALIPDLVFATGDETIEELVGKMLLERGLKLGTAESCTGGGIAQKVTSISGSSRYFEGSVVAYSNRIKNEQLSVKQTTLDQYGAVSEQTVREMVAGTIQHLGVDVAVAVSGIAGPTGGTPDKPVGTIWAAVGNKDKIITEKFRFGRDRSKNIHLTINYTLNVLRKFLLAG